MIVHCDLRFKRVRVISGYVRRFRQLDFEIQISQPGKLRKAGKPEKSTF
jgi:hypothetical protein